MPRRPINRQRCAGKHQAYESFQPHDFTLEWTIYTRESTFSKFGFGASACPARRRRVLSRWLVRRSEGESPDRVNPQAFCDSGQAAHPIAAILGPPDPCVNRISHIVNK